MNRACSSPSHGFKRPLPLPSPSPAAAPVSSPPLAPSPPPSPPPPAPSKHSTRISPILITPKSSPKGSDDPSKSVPWAGPACFNSPSPSSLPFPKFPPHRKHKSDPSPRTREPYSLGTNYVSVQRVLNLDIDADN